MNFSIKTELHPSVETFINEDELTSHLAYSTTDPSVLQEHSSLVFYYGELAARAAHQASYFKSKLEQTEATLDKDIRSVYAAKSEKVTETRIQNEVKMNQTYQEALQTHRDAKYIESMIQSIVTALEHRRSMMLQQFRSDFSAAMAS